MKQVLLLGLMLAACGNQPAAKVKFADVTVRMPQDVAQFPVRDGVEAMNANCAACHSPSMILLQPALTSEEWKAEIKKMREIYKAPIDPEAEPEILAYLEATSAELNPPEVAPTR
jgi:cytochrome c5